MLQIKALLKSDLRRQWSGLKTKHARAIAAKKIDFDAKLGPVMDKLQALLPGIDKLFAQQAVTRAAVDKVVAVTRPLRLLAKHYLDKVKGLGDPAEKDITAFLKALESDCADWEKLLDVLDAEAVVAKNTPAQLKAVREVYGVLDTLSQALINLNRSLPDMEARAKQIPKAASYDTYTELVAKKKGKPLPQKDWLKDLSADMKLLELSASALHKLTATTQVLLNRALTASVKFEAGSDYAAFKGLAQSFATSGALKDFKQRAVALAQLMKGGVEARVDFGRDGSVAGAETIALRRAVISAGEAGLKLVDPVVAAVQALP